MRNDPSRRREGKHQVTLARALSKLGVASRAEARILIRNGRLRLNNLTVRSPDVWIDLKSDRLLLDGMPLKKKAPVYIAMNKPAGIVTTRSDELGRKTVFDLLPEEAQHAMPVGRLDKDSSGLLILTSDSRFGERITGPEHKIPKTYLVRVDKPLALQDLKAMQSPLVLPDGIRLLPASIAIEGGDGFVFRMTLREGKNRQIRKVCEMFGYRVLMLKRLSIGPIALGSLKEGETRRLTPEERQAIISSTQHEE